jgi:hypothetical protein
MLLVLMISLTFRHLALGRLGSQGMHQDGIKNILPTYGEAVTILAAILATSCSPERSFSAMRRMKTYLCSTMNQDRFSSVALINIKHETTNYVEDNCMSGIIDTFGRLSNRAHFFFS